MRLGHQEIIVVLTRAGRDVPVPQHCRASLSAREELWEVFLSELPETGIAVLLMPTF